MFRSKLVLPWWGRLAGHRFSLAVIGLVFAGQGQRNTRDYFLGDAICRGGASFPFRHRDEALTFIGVPAIAYAGDLGFMQIVLGYAGA